MMNQNNSEQNLKKNDKFKSFLSSFNKIINKNNSFLNFALYIFIVSVFWCIYVLIADNFAIMLNWDYSSQYMCFYYDYYDIWRHFFKTGEFVLIDFTTYFGVDNIGSNSYYGLFDPFVILLTLFKRSYIPQAFTFLTMIKIVVSACLMRCYLLNLKIKEGTANLGATAYAFSGYMCFMVGFPSFVSTVIYVPLLLLGVEKVIRERKPSILVWSIFLIGITSFFFLVVLCIFGVGYALFRFFQTIKERKLKENITVIIMGVCSFAVGLMLCAFTVIPSIRQSTLTGRTSSIGNAYLNALIDSFKDGSFFSLLFEQVGGSAAREIMPLVSFFYPTGGFQYLPMMVPASSNKYDAWVASIFCYTPFVILFFLALLNSVRKKKISHFIAILISLYLLFTDFAYYGFYAFTGNGYGRWFLVLVPLIIYYGCSAFDQIDKMPRGFPIAAGVIAILATIGTYFLTVVVCKDVTFVNENEFTYFKTEYLTAGEYTSSYKQYSFNTIVTLILQIVFVVAEGLALAIFPKSKKILKFLQYVLTAEVILMGNMTYVFCGMWSLKTTFNGGTLNFSDSIKISDYIKQEDSSFYRSYFETANGDKNFANAVGFNGSSSFHSLMNFEVFDYAKMMHMTGSDSRGTSYGQEWYNPSWSAVYSNKRFGSDLRQGYKYYVIKKGGYPGFESQNVPFGSTKVATYKNYTIYKNENAVSLGYAVDSESLYYMRSADEYHSSSYFLGSSDYYKLRLADQTMIKGAIFDDDTSINNFSIKDPYEANLALKNVKDYSINSMNINNKYKATYYVTNDDDLFLAQKDKSYRNEGPLYFLNHYVSKETKTSNFTYKRDVGKIVLEPAQGEFFNTDSRGCYFDIEINKKKGEEPRIYMFGNRINEDSSIEENVQLNYEYGSLYNTRNDGTQVFGMYAEGLVKYICFCAPSGEEDISFQFPRLHMQEYENIVAETQYVKENELTDCYIKSSNVITCKSNFAKESIVKTTLPYDDSWSVSINTKKQTTFKIDGGFLGFIAPAGEKEYTIEYETKGLGIGVALFVIGSGIYFTYLGLDFLKKTKNSGDLLELSAK